MSRYLGVLFLVLWAAYALSFSQARAQLIACAERANVISSLTTKYSEVRRIRAVQGSSFLFEFWGSAAGSWTLTRTDTRGLTCIMAVGETWNADTDVSGDDT